MKLRSPNTDWERSIISVYMSSVLHRGKGLVSLWSWLLGFFGDPSHCYAVLLYTAHIEIPTMLQPKTWLFQGKYWLVVPSKQQPGNNHETTCFWTCFWVVTTMDLIVTTIHQLATGSCIFITTPVATAFQFSFFILLLNFNKSTCKCMHA